MPPIFCLVWNYHRENTIFGCWRLVNISINLFCWFSFFLMVDVWSSDRNQKSFRSPHDRLCSMYHYQNFCPQMRNNVAFLLFRIFVQHLKINFTISIRLISEILLLCRIIIKNILWISLTSLRLFNLKVFLFASILE